MFCSVILVGFLFCPDQCLASYQCSWKIAWNLKTLPVSKTHIHLSELSTRIALHESYRLAQNDAVQIRGLGSCEQELQHKRVKVEQNRGPYSLTRSGYDAVKEAYLGNLKRCLPCFSVFFNCKGCFR